MGKRKQRPPQKATEEKRKCLSWNMLDNAENTHDLVIDDIDENAENGTVSNKRSSILTEKEKNNTDFPTVIEGGACFDTTGTSYRSADLFEIYELHADNCLFSIPVYTELCTKKGAWKCELAEFQIQFSPHPIFVPLPTEKLPDITEFSLFVSKDGEKNIFSCETNRFKRELFGRKKVRNKRKADVTDVKFWFVDSDLPLVCFEALDCKSFQVVIDKFECKNKTVTLKIYGTEALLLCLSCPGEAVRMAKKQNHSLITLMQHFYGITTPDYDHLPYTKKHDIDELYRVIKERHMSVSCQVLPGIQHESLLPRLRPYQQQAITWMLNKERNIKECDKPDDQLHMLYTEVVTADGQTVYFHKYAGIFVLEKPCCVAHPPGGILGDEMGLGKTVEVLACMLHNPRENLPLPDPLPFVEVITLKEDEISAKKKKRKQKQIIEDSISPESDDETIIYSDDANENISLDLSSQSDLNTTDQSESKDVNNHLDKSEIKNFTRTECENFKESKNIFTEKPEINKSEFECLCGAYKLRQHGRLKKHPAQCVKCHLWQHAECVNYDLKDPYRGEFKCPHCHVASDPIPSGATLIISPFSIAHQWLEEILKHVKKEAINVFMYNGVYKQGFIQPRTLAKQDIVITTYETLRKEIDYVDLPHCNSSEGRKLRHAKRFMAIPSPLTAVEWWRICLDEAQMVECTTTKTSEMALRLKAINRWCVTGTPIQRSIDDLYGLLLFLGVDPYWVYMWWTKLVFKPYCHGVPHAMHDLLTSVLWRTVKTDVLDQINIPQQTDEVHWLTFSPVEEHFYRRQYRDCVRLSMERLSKWTDSNIRLSSLDRRTVSQLLYPLIRLRQACCHPQAVRGEFLPLHKSTMTMEELLESLTKKAKLEAEESHRALVAAINGEAGLLIIKEEFVEAVEKYRDVLRSVEEHKDTLKTDSLQQLHAMYNLREILVSKPEGVAPTLRDDQLPKQIDELRDRYMAKAVAYAKSTEEALVPLQLDVKQLEREFQDYSEWWLEVVQWAIDRDLDDNLVLKVRDDLLDNRNPQVDTLVRSCRSASGLEYAVNSQLTSMETAYTAVKKAMKGLEGIPSQDLINKTVECCLRPVDNILKNCPFCQSEELFETYEAKLFSFVEKGIEGHMDHLGYQVNTKRQGTWADSEAVKALRSILTFAKHYRVSEELIENGTTHIKLIEAMKKEFKKLRAHWAGIKEYVANFDELDMSTTRLRLRLPEEPIPETPQLNILEKSELSQHKLKLASDRIIAQGDLRKKQGQLLYLTNLAKNQTNNKDGKNPEPCPICQQELGKEWSVMQCGHCYCIECIRILVERASFGRRNFSVKCAICRQATHQGEISYVMTSRELQPDDVGVKGSHSTKVEAVVRCLLNIQREDPKSKSLVFSTWIDVLSVIATALEENDIKYKALYSSGKFQENLTSFKEDEDVSTLLLPVHSGANGLNLIEATNVLLVEPILNPAQELQAIGRVHRIGQTKPTHVHRFLVRHTIEQKMKVLLQSMDKHSVLEKSEESGLTIGDLSSLFSQQIEEEDREGVHSLDEEESSSPRPDTEVPSTSGTQQASVEQVPCTSSSSQVDSGNGTDVETPGSSQALTYGDDSICLSINTGEGDLIPLPVGSLTEMSSCHGKNANLLPESIEVDISETPEITKDDDHAGLDQNTDIDTKIEENGEQVIREEVEGLGSRQEMEVPVSREEMKVSVSREEMEVPVSREDMEGSGSREEMEGSGSRQEMEVPVSREEKKVPVSREEMEVPVSREEMEVPVSREEMEGSGSRKEMEGSGSRKEIEGSRQDMEGSVSRQEIKRSGSRQEMEGTGSRQEMKGSGSRQEMERSGNSHEIEVSGIRQEIEGSEIRKIMVESGINQNEVEQRGIRQEDVRESNIQQEQIIQEP